MIARVRAINIVRHGDRFADMTKKELIAQCKPSLALYSRLSLRHILSNNTTIIFMSFIFADLLLSNQLNKLAIERISSIIRLFSIAFGLEFKYCQDIINIFNHIEDRCGFLGNQDLNDNKYENTLYQILLRISKELNQRDLPFLIFEKMIIHAMNEIKSKIALF